MIHFVKNIPINDNVPENFKEIVFGAGCFWGVERKFWDLPGVFLTSVGYSGGDTENPSYEDVCYRNTNHAEVVKITYDSDVIDLMELLKIFWECHDPTQGMRQGNDVGTQYRSSIFYHDSTQKAIADKVKANFQEQYDNNIVTEITAFNKFYIAEDYHQNYYNNNKYAPYCNFVIKPKIEKYLNEKK